jgi:hypothetical protein
MKKQQKTQKTKPKGVLYIAKDRDSFLKFYEAVRDEIFLPSLKYMPSKKELKERMEKGLNEKKSEVLK